MKIEIRPMAFVEPEPTRRPRTETQMAYDDAVKDLPVGEGLGIPVEASKEAVEAAVKALKSAARLRGLAVKLAALETKGAPKGHVIQPFKLYVPSKRPRKAKDTGAPDAGTEGPASGTPAGE